MFKVNLKVETEFCGGAAIGTVDLIMIVRKYLNLGLNEAKTLIDPAVFEGAEVELKVANQDIAIALIDEINQLPPPVEVEAKLTE